MKKIMNVDKVKLNKHELIKQTNTIFTQKNVVTL